MSPFVLLTRGDVERATGCAALMVAHNEALGYKHAAFVPGNDARANMAVGCAGEIAFAAWRGIHWRCKVGDYRKADVAGYHVRCRRKHDQRLNIQQRDPDDAVMVLVVQHSEWTYEIVGWIVAAEGRRVGQLDDPGHIKRPAHFVERRHLHPLSELPEVKDARSYA